MNCPRCGYQMRYVPERIEVQEDVTVVISAYWQCTRWRCGYAVPAEAPAGGS